MPRTQRSNLPWVLLIFGIVAVLLLWHRSANNLIPWQTNYTNAAVQARADHKLILLDFYADWCGPCRAMAADTWSDPTVADAVSGYLPVHVNIDDDPKLSQHFGVQGILNIVLIDGDGNVIGQHAGQMGPDQFIQWLHFVKTGN